MQQRRKTPLTLSLSKQTRLAVFATLGSRASKEARGGERTIPDGSGLPLPSGEGWGEGGRFMAANRPFGAAISYGIVRR